MSVASAGGGLAAFELASGAPRGILELGHTGALAARAGALWVTRDGGFVSRLDISRREVTGTVEVGDYGGGLVVADGQVWVANGGSGTVSRIDAGAVVVTATVAVGVAPTGIAVGEGAVWVVLSGSGALVRLSTSF